MNDWAHDHPITIGPGAAVPGVMGPPAPNQVMGPRGMTSDQLHSTRYALAAFAGRAGSLHQGMEPPSFGPDGQIIDDVKLKNGPQSIPQAFYNAMGPKGQRNVKYGVGAATAGAVAVKGGHNFIQDQQRIDARTRATLGSMSTADALGYRLRKEEFHLQNYFSPVSSGQADQLYQSSLEAYGTHGGSSSVYQHEGMDLMKKQGMDVQEVTALFRQAVDHGVADLTVFAKAIGTVSDAAKAAGMNTGDARKQFSQAYSTLATGTQGNVTSALATDIANQHLLMGRNSDYSQAGFLAGGSSDYQLAAAQGTTVAAIQNAKAGAGTDPTGILARADDKLIAQQLESRLSGIMGPLTTYFRQHRQELQYSDSMGWTDFGAYARNLGLVNQIAQGILSRFSNGEHSGDPVVDVLKLAFNSQTQMAAGAAPGDIAAGLDSVKAKKGMSATAASQVKNAYGITDADLHTVTTGGAMAQGGHSGLQGKVVNETVARGKTSKSGAKLNQLMTSDAKYAMKDPRTGKMVVLTRDQLVNNHLDAALYDPNSVQILGGQYDGQSLGQAAGEGTGFKDKRFSPDAVKGEKGIGPNGTTGHRDSWSGDGNGPSWLGGTNNSSYDAYMKNKGKGKGGANVTIDMAPWAKQWFIANASGNSSTVPAAPYPDPSTFATGPAGTSN
jgi:hypothetical protein